MNKVYIRVTEALEGDPSVIATLESYGGKNLNNLSAVHDTILFINIFGVIVESIATSSFESMLKTHDYREIEQKEMVHTYNLPIPSENPALVIVPLNVPKGYEAIVGGKPVTEIEVEIRKVEPWQPTYGEEYFFADIFGTSSLNWTATLWDVERRRIGNCFKTQEEAAAFGEIARKYFKMAVDEYNKQN